MVRRVIYVSLYLSDTYKYLLLVNRDNWARTVSPNPNVKVYIGAPASSSAAGSGYVDVPTITTIIQKTMAEYSSFGGVMLWDISQAYGVFIINLPNFLSLNELSK